MRARAIAVRAAAMTVVLVLAACRTPTGADNGRLANGTWGGDHVRLDVMSGVATTEYDCAHGTIDEPLVPDRNGRFSVRGTHTFERGGPIRLDEVPDRHPARYDGRVDGEKLDLTVIVTDRQQTVGVFTLTFRAAPRLFKCL